jgi:hypothetical protein
LSRRFFLSLFNFARTLFAISLARQSFLGAPLFPWLQVEGVTLDFLYDVFLLHFSFEAPQGAFQRFSILKMDFRQLDSPPSNKAVSRFLTAAAKVFTRRRGSACVEFSL